GVPIKVMQDEESLFVGAVFVTNSFSNYSDYVMTLVKIFCSAAIVTFALVFCFVGLFSYRLTKPLQQMSRAAKAFGNGDFSKRVRVDGNDEIAELAKAFNNMADSLSVSEGMRRTFIANVSHELKTPMTTIAGFIDGILDGTIPRERERHYLNIVTVEVKRLSRLVTSMLALSRIDSGELKMVRQSFDVSATVLNTFLTFEQKIEQRSITVTGFDESEPLFVEGDPDMIHQVVYNLVENATKFTNEGGSINVSVVNEGNRAVVAIRNTGPGISSEQIGFVFDRFYKTDKSRSHDKNGMGLGLYLVKTIVQLHGGEITAESVEGEYTTFTFWLPKRKEMTAKKRSVQREEKSAVRAVQSEDEKENYSLDDSNQQEG
ncbi:MAG: HAMP domain-containing histidine kinase, partial [Lachnospiraceae bacterium]|nr:HAMP domain-containing histidine kinase [Lachnospiraceae bacterium]